jgi:pimeloyl-ACP methyl ester carboxylesterase
MGGLHPTKWLQPMRKFGSAYYHRFNPLVLIREVVLGTRMKLNPEALIFGSGQLFKSWMVMDRLNEIKVKALVLAGRDDFQFPTKYQAALSAGIEGSRLEIIERAGHNVQSERPLEVMEAITGFIDF